MQRTKSDADEGKINKRAFVVCYSVPRCFHARAKTKKKNTDRKMAKSAPTSEKKIQSERSRDIERENENSHRRRVCSAPSCALKSRSSPVSVSARCY